MSSVGSASALPRLSRNNSKSGLASRERLGPWGLAAPHLATADGMLGSIGTRPLVRRPHRVQPLALQAASAPLSSCDDDNVARTLDFLTLDGDGDAPPRSPPHPGSLWLGGFQRAGAPLILCDRRVVVFD